MNKKIILVGAVAAIAGLTIAGCGGGGGGGDTGGTGNDSAGEGVFTPGNLGTLSVTLNESIIDVSDTTGFTARITNAAGQGVAGTRVSCDSEDGVAIIEPTTGAEITDANGAISGRIGCESPGSYIFACRLPVGTTKRTLITVRCSGSIPAGFDGFPGAAGGGLGTGGSGDSDNGGNDGNNLDGVRITSLEFLDEGEITEDATATASIDVVQRICSGGSSSTSSGSTSSTPPVFEGFFDSGLRVELENNSNSTITLTGYRYTIPNATGSGTADFESSEFAFLGGNQGTVTLEKDKKVTVFGLFARATGSAGTGAKQFVNLTTGNVVIDSDLGFRTVEVTVVGENDQGESVELTSSSTISFGAFNRCD